MLLNGVENERFYFVHSYAAMEVKPADTSRFDIDLSDSPERVSWCSYGRSRFVAAYEHGPLSATQFHPEKVRRRWLPAPQELDRHAVKKHGSL